MGGMNLLDRAYCGTVQHNSASHVATTIPIWPMRIVIWEISGNSQDGGGGSYETEGPNDANASA